MEALTIDIVINNIRGWQGRVPPTKLHEYYSFLSAEYCFISDKIGVLQKQRAGKIAQLLLEDNKLSVNKAERIADYTEIGQEILHGKAQMKGILEVIRSLKKQQEYYENELKNQY